MPITRRRLIAGSSAAAAAAALGPAFRGDDVADWLRRPSVAFAAGRTRAMPPPGAARHLLSRATFGQGRGDVARVEAMGTRGWLDAQLAADVGAAGSDAAVEAALGPLETLGWTAEKIHDASADLVQRARIRDELVAAKLYRAVHGRHQLLEVLVDHWANHFSVYMDDYHMMMQTVADRDVLRRHALLTFRGLLHADAADVAMMQYLSTLTNTRRGPNENYAREVMELHTLGVGGGYVFEFDRGSAIEEPADAAIVFVPEDDGRYGLGDIEGAVVEGTDLTMLTSGIVQANQRAARDQELVHDLGDAVRGESVRFGRGCGHGIPERRWGRIVEIEAAAHLFFVTSRGRGVERHRHLRGRSHQDDRALVEGVERGRQFLESRACRPGGSGRSASARTSGGGSGAARSHGGAWSRGGASRVVDPNRFPAYGPVRPGSPREHFAHE